MSKPDSRIFELILAYSEGKLSQSEYEELQGWLEQDSENKRFLAEYLTFLKQVKRVGFADKAYHDDAWNNISAKLVKRKKRIVPVVLRYAAAIAIPIILGVSAYLWFIQPAEVIDIEVVQAIEPGKPRATLVLDNGEQIDLENWTDSIIALSEGTHLRKNAEMLNYVDADIQREVYNTLRIPRGGEYFLILSDGTKVWLNSDTELRYPVKFVKDTREVYLKGEAYFEVAENKKKPFIVRTKDLKTEVLGTKFNISAYDDEEYVATTLIEGSVSIETKGNNEILVPGNQATILKGTNNINITQVNPQLYISWVKGVFEFENMQLDYIMAQIGRWYDIDISFQDDDLKNIRFTGAIKRDKPFKFVLDLVERITDVEFKIEENHIEIGS